MQWSLGFFALGQFAFWLSGCTKKVRENVCIAPSMTGFSVVDRVSSVFTGF